MERVKGERFIAYLNDDGTIVNSYVIILELNDYVKFQTGDNIITIPRERLLKLKERLQ